MKKEADLNPNRRYFVSNLQQKIVFIYKMKQIQVKNHGNPVKIVVIKIGMRIAIYFGKRIEYRSEECSDSKKNMSAYADYAPSFTCVRFEFTKKGIDVEVKKWT